VLGVAELERELDFGTNSSEVAWLAKRRGILKGLMVGGGLTFILPPSPVYTKRREEGFSFTTSSSFFLLLILLLILLLKDYKNACGRTGREGGISQSFTFLYSLRAGREGG
jgi:hypothetical protein